MSCVLTLALNETAQERFETLRQRYFPPELNRIPAHLTLFHTLPESDETSARLTEAVRSQVAFSMTVAEVRSIGRGVAYFLEAPPARALHRRLSEMFAPHLSSQDRQGFRPHVVVQNKVAPPAAKETLVLLQAEFRKWDCEAVGLDLWRYLGGPWQHLQRYVFNG